jgi:hypothetical protein
MKITYFLLFKLAYCDKIIKNINIPSCRNCVHYKASTYNNEFTSLLNTCEKFGEKNIVTDEIKYNYADTCRNDETKCGHEGKYFEEEKNMNMKILKHSILSKLPTIILFNIIIVSSMIQIYCNYITYPK